MSECLECKQETSNPKFCSSSCAASYNNKRRKTEGYSTKNQTKILVCKCGTTFLSSIHASIKKSKCIECWKKSCKWCGQKHPDVPKTFVCTQIKLIPILEQYFGLNPDLIGTPDIFLEVNRIKEKIQDLYIDKSLVEIRELIGYNQHPTTLYSIIRKLNIEFRSHGKSQRLAIKNNRYVYMPIGFSKWKHGWHTTWENKEVFYRSSYELDFAKQLDESKIKYEVENLRIEYWDTKSNCYRIAIPDFYLPETNEIVEIKSSWTYDEQNMKDRFKRFKELGYSCKLILDKLDYPVV